VKKFINKVEQRSIFAGALIQDTNRKLSSIKAINGNNKLKKTGLISLLIF
jgi:hypothetical protein